MCRCVIECLDLESQVSCGFYAESWCEFVFFVIAGSQYVHPHHKGDLPMTRISSVLRLRHSLYLIGVILIIGSLIGAKALKGGGDGDKNDPSNTNTAKLVGPVVMGTVDSNPQPIKYLLPPVLQSGTISRVFVKDGMDVKAGDRLYEFDTSQFQSELKVAQCGVDLAKTKVAEAQDGKKVVAKKVENLKLFITFAEHGMGLRAETYNQIKANLERYYRTENSKLTQAELDDKLAKDHTLSKANADWVIAKDEWEKAKLDLETGRTEEEVCENKIKQAEAVVRQAEEQVNKAKLVIELCTIKAKVDGTIEQVTIGEGATLGVGTLTPALYLVPAGSRVVRAEVEADFSYRVTDKDIGKVVTIYDNTDPKLTYKGKIVLISKTFLPKRTANEGFLTSETRVREALIEVIDASPADKPALCVGQRVRIDMGQ
jgi:multidrug resistance efflux pump